MVGYESCSRYPKGPRRRILRVERLPVAMIFLFLAGCAGGPAAGSGSTNNGAQGPESVVPTLPQQVEIVAPADGQLITAAQVSVQLSLSGRGAEGLRYEVGVWPSDAANGAPAKTAIAPATAVPLPLSGLVAGQSYELRGRVIRERAVGPADVGKWSAPRTIVLAAGAAAPVPDNPAADGIEVDTAPVLGWSYSGNADQYRIELYASGASSPMVTADNLTSPSYTVTRNLTPGRYAYRVQARDGSGVWGSWSPLTHFTLNPAAELTPTLIADGETSISPRFTLGWRRVYGVRAFRLQISATDGFGGALIADTEVRGNPVFHVAQAYPVGTTLYFRVQAQTDAGETLSWSPVTRFVVGDLGFRFVPVIPSGGSASFSMGDPESGYDAGPVHTVRLTVPFEMQEYPVTNSQFAQIANWLVDHEMAKAEEKRLVTFAAPGGGQSMPLVGFGALDYGDQFGLRLANGRVVVVQGRGDQPVVGVSWYGAVLFANAVSLLSGESPAYDASSWSWMRRPGAYRLPTEAEWEYAMRGTDGRIYPWGDVLSPARANYLRSYDPFEDPYPPFTSKGGPLTPIGFYDGRVHAGFATRSNASPFGVFGLVGNIWQWCWDWYSPKTYGLEGTDAANPDGPPTGDERVTRGGAWNVGADYIRGTARGHYPPGGMSYSTGFRLVRTIP